jgi:uncharacterized protein YjiS (DUF1127 family)
MSSLYVLYDNPELNLRVRRATPLFQLIKRAVADVQAWNRIRATRNELNRMPDYLLHDLGIERSDINTVASDLGRR